MIFKENQFRYILYAIYLIFVSLGFLYFLFPDKIIKDHLEKQATIIFPGTSMTIGTVAPSFLPLGLKISPIYIAESEKPLIHMDFLDIYPQVMTFFSTKETSYNIYGKVFGGKIEGTFKISEKIDFPKHILNARFTDISIPEMLGADKRASFKMTGVLNGQIDFMADQTREADMKLTVSDGNIQISNLYMGNAIIFFNKVDSTMTLKDSVIEIIQCHLYGDDMEISLFGQIQGAWPIIESGLDFTGHISPHHTFLKKAENKILMNFFPDQRADNKGFSYRVTGTFRSPSFFWKQ